MIITIENNFYKADISTKGGELQNLINKKNGKDIIWQGDKSVWGNHAPILFPFVTRCLGGYFMIEEQRCEYTRNHGFARDLEWKCIANTSDSATFVLTQSEETLYRYPYTFSLKTEYKLTEKGINWKISVKNTDNKTFKFSTGTHAAFSLNGNKAEDFIVEFEKKEPLTSVLCTPDGYLKADETGKLPLTNLYGEKEAGIIPVTSAGFGNGHLFTNITSDWVGLRNLKDNSIIKIQTKGFPYCMIWQNTSGTPQFVCIEPWHGLPDAENTKHIWNDKTGLVELRAGNEFTNIQNIEVE